MEFNLRKSRKLEAKIGSEVSKRQKELSSAISVRVNADKAEIITFVNNHRQEYLNNLQNLNNLSIARQEIRDQIALANFHVGIDKLMSQKVLAESKLAKLNLVLGFQLFDEKELDDSIDIAKKQLENGDRFVRANIAVNVLTKIDEDQFKLDKLLLAKEVENMEDKLAELNYSSKIKLSANTVKLLQDNHLL